MSGHPFEHGFNVVLRSERLGQPLMWRRPRRIFVNSMSDLFHEDIADAYIATVFDVMERAHWHTFQILTKRPERAASLAPVLPWPNNVWLGASVENQYWARRIDPLRAINAHVRFLSCEPLLGPLDLDLRGIHWVIAGGESGPRARPMHLAWIRSLRDQCLADGIPFFFKQWGSHDAEGVRMSKKASGRLLDGRTWNEPPHGETART